MGRMDAESGEGMITEVQVEGYFAENSFFYIDDAPKHGFLIDPGAEAERLLAIIKDNNWRIEKILLTHGHFDHTGAVEEIRNALAVPVYAFATADAYLLDPFKNLSALCGSPIVVSNAIHFVDGEIISLRSNSSFGLQVIYTPGHTTDSVVFYAEKSQAAFVGDTIFKGSIGNYHFPGGNLRDLRCSITEKIFTLPDGTTLYSGHSEPTTVGAEKRRYGF